MGPLPLWGDSEPRVLGKKSGPLVSSQWHLAGTPLPRALADPAGSSFFCNAKISRGTSELATSVSQRNCDAVSTGQCTNTTHRQPANLNHNVIMKMIMAFSVSHTGLPWGDSLKTVEVVKVGRHIRSNSSKHVFSWEIEGEMERGRGDDDEGGRGAEKQEEFSD